jgi:hypothetical protein
MARLSKDKRDKLLLVAMATLSLVAGLWFFIKSRDAALVQIQTRRAKAMDKLDKARNVVRRAAQVEADMQAATNKLQAVEKTMASGDLFTWSYLFLDKARAGHEISIIDVGRPSRGDVNMLAQFPYEAATFSVRGAAYYHDFGRFLADFENANPYFRVQNLSLTPGLEEGTGTNSSLDQSGEGKLSFKFDIVALIKPTP